MVEKDGDDEVSEAHAGEDESRQRSKGPEGHFELTLGFLRVLYRENEANGGHDEADGGECTENDEKDIVGQSSVLSVRCTSQDWFGDLPDEQYRSGMMFADHEHEGAIKSHDKLVRRSDTRCPDSH